MRYPLSPVKRQLFARSPLAVPSAFHKTFASCVKVPWQISALQRFFTDFSLQLPTRHV
jgi:hypothetical protein